MSMTLPPSSLGFRSPFAVRWTRTDCDKLESDGFLSYRYELVEGDIIQKMPQNIPHRIAISRLTSWLYGVFLVDYVQSQAAIDVSPEDNPTNRPEPDVVVLTEPLQSILASQVANPTAAQIRLVVEVSDSTRDFDMTVKAGLYARAGIPEYWVLDLTNRTLHILREPEDGSYSTTTVHRESDAITCLAAPEQPVTVSYLLP
jgi:Uma2 family endonuclease